MVGWAWKEDCPAEAPQILFRDTWAGQLCTRDTQHRTPNLFCRRSAPRHVPLTGIFQKDLEKHLLKASSSHVHS